MGGIMEATKEVGFSDKMRLAVALANEVKALVIKTPQDYALAGEKEDAIRVLEKELEADYKEHPVIVRAKEIQLLKGDMAEILKGARIGVKAKRNAYDEADERKRLEDQRRLQAEAQRNADDDALKAALAAEKSGDKKAAEAIIQQEVVVPTVIIQKDTPKAGAPVSVRWSAEVFDGSLVPRKFLMLDMTKLNAQARIDKENTNIPGVRAVSRKV